jgi:hypothetical protein
VEQASTLPWTGWSGIVTTSLQNVTFAVSNNQSFFRVRGQ